MFFFLFLFISTFSKEYFLFLETLTLGESKFNQVATGFDLTFQKCFVSFPKENN